MNENIDVVIAWVDGNHPAHKKKIAPYLPEDSKRQDDKNGETRYRSVGEIYYCVASIVRFAPFVRKIFVVTDKQNPQLNDFIEKNFPENKIPIEIIDHEIIFSDYETYLPVFNSRAVETCIYRIPGLSEKYVYFNDDFFLIRPVDRSDWFEGEKIIAYGSWRNMVIDKFISFIKPLRGGAKPVGFKDGMTSAAGKLGYWWRYFHLDHMPHPLRKSVIADFFKENQHLFKLNIAHKFRSRKQFNTHEIYYLLMLKAGRANIRPASEYLLYMKPVGRGENYIKRKLGMYENNKNLKFCCMGSLDLASEQDRTTLLTWLAETIGIKIPPQPKRQ